MLFKNLLAAAAVVPLTLAQQTIYGECGGQYYSGPTSCAAGLTCVYFNPYYSQCLPNTTTGEGSTTTTSTTSTSTSSASKTSTSTSSASKTSTSTSSASKTSSTFSSFRSTSTVASTTKTTSTTSISATTTSTKSTSSVKSTSTVSTTSGTVTGASTTATITGNPFSGVALYANPYYSSEIYTSAIPSLTGSLAAQASLVAEVPTFVWLDKAAKVPLMGTYLGNIRSLNNAGANPPVAGTFVVYDLPDRDCAALASNGEYTIADNGVANYFAYIDAIEALVVEYSDVKIILIIEPDSLANLVTNLNVAECAAAESAYLECVEYAIKTLNYPNVAMYLDAGHAGWLGWSANIGPAATLFAQVYTAAGSPSQVRGLATNVANYNAWTIATAPSYTSGDANYDEELYITALAPLLVTAGYPAHFITDTSRNGVQPTKQNAWGDWCNVIGTGFGVRPTTNTGNTLEDAFVWVKPGGECDGTSNTTSPRYDAHCGYSDALQPAPEAGTWFEAYFVQLLTNANPAF